MTDKLREALEKLHHAVCGETGFAAAVRQESGKAYPWPALDIADELARAALAAAPQPAPERAQRLQDAMVQDILETPIEEIEAEIQAIADREALVEVIASAIRQTHPSQVHCASDYAAPVVDELIKRGVRWGEKSWGGW